MNRFLRVAAGAALLASTALSCVPAVADGGAPGGVNIASMPPDVTLSATVGSTSFSAVDAASSTASGQNGQSIVTGTPTTGSYASYALGSAQQVNLTVTGTFSLTFATEVSADGGTTWIPIKGNILGASADSANAFSSPVVARFNVAGFTHFRLRVTTYSSNASLVATVKATGTLGTLHAAIAPTGATPWSEVVPNNTTGVVIKAAPGVLQGVSGSTNGSVPLYAKFYDTATTPTCGSGTPKLRYQIPAAGTPANGGGSNLPPLALGGAQFASGIGLCVTAGIADNDTTAPASGVGLLNLGYQ